VRDTSPAGRRTARIDGGYTGAMLALLLLASASAQQNLGFEARQGRVWGWSVVDSAASVRPAEGRHGQALHVHRDPREGHAWPHQFVEAQGWSGHTVTLTGWVRTEALQEGRAGYALQAMGVDGVLAVVRPETEGVDGSTAWSEAKVRLLVPDGTVALVFGPWVSGHGDVWFDDMQLWLDAVRVDPIEERFPPIDPPDRPWTPAERVPPTEPDQSDLDPVHVAGRPRTPRRSRTCGAGGGAVGPAPAAGRGRRTGRWPGSERVAAFDALSAWFATHTEALRDAGASRADALLARQVAWSMARWIEATSTSERYAELRDAAMAANLTFLVDELFPDDRVVVWAHNGHIRHAESATWRGGEPSMGELFHRARPDLVYTIGLHAHSGAATTNRRRPYHLAPPDPGGLEALLATPREQALFVDLSGAPAVPGTAWMRQPLSTLSWGLHSQPLVVRDQYDGVLFVHTVAVPRYR